MVEEESVFIHNVGLVPLTEIREYERIVQKEVETIKNEFMGKPATEQTYLELKGKLDYLYGKDTFMVLWGGGTGIDIYIKDRMKLVKILREQGKNVEYVKTKDQFGNCILNKIEEYSLKKY